VPDHRNRPTSVRLHDLRNGTVLGWLGQPPLFEGWHVVGEADAGVWPRWEAAGLARECQAGQAWRGRGTELVPAAERGDRVP
jgi:hypothetical protein